MKKKDHHTLGRSVITINHTSRPFICPVFARKIPQIGPAQHKDYIIDCRDYIQGMSN